MTEHALVGCGNFRELAWKNMKPKDYVHPWYSIAAFKKTWAPFIKLVLREEY